MLSLWLRRVARPAVLASLLLSSGVAMASGLQVSPISLSLQARESASGLTLSNSGDNVVHAQVRVYQWLQDEQGDQLTPSRGLLASPPMIELKPGENQLIRIIRAKAPPQGAGAVEDTYRILVNEIPVKSANQTTGLQFTLSYSLPVFVQPVGVTKTSPQLQWSTHLQPDGKAVTLRVSNSGNGHAQLAGLSFVDTAGNSTEINPGLLGYVLPGATMNWTLKMPPSALTAGGKFKVMMNGTQTTPDVTMDTSIR
ncbi:fimbrial biogenesis chaperone [Psychrobacter aquaticus]|uniref:Sigma-fimbriae chaperone protein n=1 Tax=Psychrobacter aquaticus CMS 56 TaxID=1354303 RepID=U4T9F4_9GAMM|nr:molecular chaperone [Psychrobacter aquaticus]ERL55108.1 Sigma-fimbriae chaperone protein [Psychrobacter aquaticus CMS 56]